MKNFESDQALEMVGVEGETQGWLKLVSALYQLASRVSL